MTKVLRDALLNEIEELILLPSYVSVLVHLAFYHNIIEFSDDGEFYNLIDKFDENMKQEFDKFKKLISLDIKEIKKKFHSASVYHITENELKEITKKLEFNSELHTKFLEIYNSKYRIKKGGNRRGGRKTQKTKKNRKNK